MNAGFSGIGAVQGDPQAAIRMQRGPTKGKDGTAKSGAKRQKRDLFACICTVFLKNRAKRRETARPSLVSGQRTD
jgi:hypothetical protein